MFILTAVMLLAPLTSGDGVVDDSNWPQFRGPGARGVSEEKGLPGEWSSDKNVAWKLAIPGRGWSSPIVWGKLVFVTTAIAPDEVVEPRKGLYAGGSAKSQDELAWTLLCIDLESGELVWERVVHTAVPGHSVHGKNTYASETPVTDGKRVYAYFGNVGLFAYDMEGELEWERHWDTVPTRYGWGTAASPTLHGKRLILINDNEQSSFLEVLDTETGETAWKMERDEKSNWATPFVWENSKRKEIVTPGTGQVRSYSLDGDLLWSLKGMSGITISTPYASHGMVYISSGFVMSRDKPIYAIRPGAKGDISLKDGATSNEFIAWSQPRSAPYNPTTIVVGDKLYSLLDNGVLTCFDAKTGERVYDRKRVRAGSGYTASPWSYDGKLFCLDEDGVTTVVKTGDEFEIVGQNDLGEMCMASPAIADGSLLIRTIDNLYCIRSGD